MPVESIAAAQQTVPAGTQQAAIGQEDLFEILLTQLNYQDPLEPMDNQEFIAQLAQFTALEQARQQNEKIDSLLSMMSTNQAVSILGKAVQARLEASVEIGTVVGITFEQGSPRITIQLPSGEIKDQISLSQLEVIANS